MSPQIIPDVRKEEVYIFGKGYSRMQAIVIDRKFQNKLDLVDTRMNSSPADHVSSKALYHDSYFLDLYREDM